MNSFKMTFSDAHFTEGEVGRFSGLNMNYGMVMDNGTRTEAGNCIYTIKPLRISRWWVIRWFQLKVLKSVL